MNLKTTIEIDNTKNDLINFTIGNHDLENILKNYLGKYVPIIMEFDDFLCPNSLV
ncbi:hypothetical protein [Metabacillus bambusae]|uniref:Uncharacterized protein n=1 Tax=Metabacillus bambusae TaxID=2795218 RepID=A0ABS3MYX7_9BACI|nr:hypothetical protein [Metabacillus bambusae]MBO1511203.1 hypothetical protein [Metabacillus bambusae]